MCSETAMDDLDGLFADIDCGEMELFPLANDQQTNSSIVEDQQRQLNSTTPNSSGYMNLFRADTHTSFIALPDSSLQPYPASAAPLIPITVEEVNSSMASDGRHTRFVSELGLGSDTARWDTAQHTVPNMDRDRTLGNRRRRREEARGGGGRSRSRNTEPSSCASGDSNFGSTQFMGTHFTDECNQLIGGIHQRDGPVTVSSSCATDQNDPEASSSSDFKDFESVKQDKRREQNKRAAGKCRQKKKMKEKQLIKDLEEAEKSKQQKMQEILPLLHKVQRLKALLQSHQASGSCCFSGHLLQSPIDS